MFESGAKRLLRWMKLTMPDLKKHLTAKKFDDDERKDHDMVQRGPAEDLYDSEIQKLVPRLNKCLVETM